MQELIQQEQFELEVLDRLQSSRLLASLVFVGGTMLRLCHGLTRYSVDLDFWLAKKLDQERFFNQLKSCLAPYYAIKDAAIKYHTILVEIRSPGYPRSLKIEIRKILRKNLLTEPAIAYSKHADRQVMVTTPTLKEMLGAKIEAFLDRKEIRDVFDLEFLVKKGLPITAPKPVIANLLKLLDAMKPNDYRVKLGSLLEESERRYYTKENFKILKRALTAG